jgi:hypothetical protein
MLPGATSPILIFPKSHAYARNVNSRYYRALISDLFLVTSGSSFLTSNRAILAGHRVEDSVLPALEKGNM